MDEVNPNGDRYFDLSLRLLTIFVLVSLVCSVGFLIYRWVSPLFPSSPDPPIAPHGPVVESPAPATVATPPPADQVLMDPRKTFKCEERGKAVTFSDRPCDSGSVQILPLNPPQPAPGGR
jgi:hypothetical protein